MIERRMIRITPLATTTKRLIVADLTILRALSVWIEAMALKVVLLPREVEYTTDDLDMLKEAQHQALRLAQTCEAAIKTLKVKKTNGRDTRGPGESGRESK
jgi:hypothetical protein